MSTFRMAHFQKSVNNTILVHGIRDARPLKAINILKKAAMDKFSMRQDQINKWTARDITVTPRARALWKIEQRLRAIMKSRDLLLGYGLPQAKLCKISACRD